jgi:hypothetical protein
MPERIPEVWGLAPSSSNLIHPPKAALHKIPLEVVSKLLTLTASSRNLLTSNAGSLTITPPKVTLVPLPQF